MIEVLDTRVYSCLELLELISIPVLDWGFRIWDIQKDFSLT